jgi:hypothetical protein
LPDVSTSTILEAHMKVPENEPESDAIVIGGSVFVHTLPLQSLKICKEYSTLDVLSTRYASSEYQKTDILPDVYLASSLKSETRSKRGSSTRPRLTGNDKVPQNWRSFLRDNDNKTELFLFLADTISEMDTFMKMLIVTKGEDPVSNQTVNIDTGAPCGHAEAYTRLCVHARYATTEGIQILMIAANDTDVIEISFSTLPALQNPGLQQLWLVFG